MHTQRAWIDDGRQFVPHRQSGFRDIRNDARRTFGRVDRLVEIQIPRTGHIGVSRGRTRQRRTHAKQFKISVGITGIGLQRPIPISNRFGSRIVRPMVGGLGLGHSHKRAHDDRRKHRPTQQGHTIQNGTLTCLHRTKLRKHRHSSATIARPPILPDDHSVQHKIRQPSQKEESGAIIMAFIQLESK